MTKRFTAQEVITKVDGLNSISTLNKWVTFIQKECKYQFNYDYIQFFAHRKSKRKMIHRKTRTYSLEEINKFQKVAECISKLGRDVSLRKFFDDQYQINNMNQSELMSKIMTQVNIEIRNKENQLQILSKEYQLLAIKYQKLEQRLLSLEKNEQASSGWFRWKR